MKITWRDGMYLFAGICLGFSLFLVWFNVSIMIFANNILPHIDIQSVNLNLNETALVEAMNRTIGGLHAG